MIETLFIIALAFLGFLAIGKLMHENQENKHRE